MKKIVFHESVCVNKIKLEVLVLIRDEENALPRDEEKQV